MSKKLKEGVVGGMQEISFTPPERELNEFDKWISIVNEAECEEEIEESGDVPDMLDPEMIDRINKATYTTDNDYYHVDAVSDDYHEDLYTKGKEHSMAILRQLDPNSSIAMDLNQHIESGYMDGPADIVFGDDEDDSAYWGGRNESVKGKDRTKKIDEGVIGGMTGIAPTERNYGDDEFSKWMQIIEDGEVKVGKIYECKESTVQGKYANGYGEGHQMPHSYNDYFPSGADSNVVTHVSPSEQGDNPMQKAVKDNKKDEVNETREVHKELVHAYRDFLNESAKES